MRLQGDQTPIDEMHIDPAVSHGNIRFIPSPNFDERPTGCEINLLVIHNISLPPDEFGGDGVLELFTNRLDPEAHPYYRVHIRTQGFLSLPDTPGWGNHSVRAMRETRVACWGILLAGQAPLQRLFDRHRA